MRAIFRPLRQTSAHRIHPNVLPVLRKIFFVPDSMIRRTRLPDWQTRFQSKRKSSLDELDGPLQRYLRRWGDQSMEVVRHDHKLMKQIFALVAVAEKNIDKQIGGHDTLE